MIGILIIGVVSMAIVSSLLFLGTNAGTVSLSISQSSEAMALAQGCAEYALRQLRLAPTYAGNQTLALGNGTCDILTIGGAGNNDRLLCVEGSVGDVYRRMEIIVKNVLPETTVGSWQEVALFSLCE